MTNSNLKQQAHDAYYAALQADNAWQAALDHYGVDRYSLAARMYTGLRELYEAKLATDEAVRLASDRLRLAA